MTMTNRLAKTKTMTKTQWLKKWKTQLLSYWYSSRISYTMADESVTHHWRWCTTGGDLLILLMRWSCWCADPADAMILLMRWCILGPKNCNFRQWRLYDGLPSSQVGTYRKTNHYSVSAIWIPNHSLTSARCYMHIWNFIFIPKVLQSMEPFMKILTNAAKDWNLMKSFLKIFPQTAVKIPPITPCQYWVKDGHSHPFCQLVVTSQWLSGFELAAAIHQFQPSIAASAYLHIPHEYEGSFMDFPS